MFVAHSTHAHGRHTSHERGTHMPHVHATLTRLAFGEVAERNTYTADTYTAQGALEALRVDVAYALVTHAEPRPSEVDELALSLIADAHAAESASHVFTHTDGALVLTLSRDIRTPIVSRLCGTCGDTYALPLDGDASRTCPECGASVYTPRELAELTGDTRPLIWDAATDGEAPNPGAFNIGDRVRLKYDRPGEGWTWRVIGASTLYGGEDYALEIVFADARERSIHVEAGGSVSGVYPPSAIVAADDGGDDDGGEALAASGNASAAEREAAWDALHAEHERAEAGLGALAAAVLDAAHERALAENAQAFAAHVDAEHVEAIAEDRERALDGAREDYAAELWHAHYMSTCAGPISGRHAQELAERIGENARAIAAAELGEAPAQADAEADRLARIEAAELAEAGERGALILDARAADGCLYEAPDADTLARALADVVFSAACIGQALTIEGRVYREDGDAVALRVTRSEDVAR